MIWIIGGTSWEVSIKKDLWHAESIDTPVKKIVAGGREALIALIHELLKEVK